MAARRLLACLVVLATWTACKGKDNPAQPSAGLDARCDKLATACGDNDKHIAKIVEECKQAAKKQNDKGCADSAIALYDCYQKELCGKADKVWAVEDLGVLAERQNKCVAERAALRACVGQ
jgi:hypothetical protein